MDRDNGRNLRLVGDHGEPAARARRRQSPAVETLEGRRLLSFYTGPTASRPIFSNGTFFTSTVTGGGYEKAHRLRNGEWSFDLIGTNAGSTLTITSQTNRFHFKNAALQIGELKIETGALGAINAGSAILDGPVSTIHNTVSSIALGSISSSARIDIEGDLNSFSAPVKIGAGGLFRVAGNLTGNLSGPLTVDGGRFIIGHDATGTFSPSDLNVMHAGVVSIGHNLNGGLNVSGNLNVNTGGEVTVGNNLGSLQVGQGIALDTNGQFLVGGDVTGDVNVAQKLSIGKGSAVALGRDVKDLNVQGDLVLAGGKLLVSRDLGPTVINGNVVVTNGGGIAVGGSLNGLTVNGAFQGQGSATVADLAVGLNLINLSVLGGGANQGGIQNANFDITKNIQGLNVSHGIFNSFITAGVLIDGAGNGGNSGVSGVGADGPDAVFDSEIRAGVQIKNLTLNGNVRSDYVTNPNPGGYRTRIVAGEDRAGNYLAGGNIDNFQITGSLIDSVLAASVAPYGGNGTLPSNGYGTPPPSVATTSGDFGNNTYDAPAGVIVGGPISAPKAYPNYSEASYYNETFTKISYNTAIDPTIDDTILPGAINQSFASPPLSQTQITNPNVSTTVTSGNGSSSTQTSMTTTLTLPLPTKSTVLGGVISNLHDDTKDFAGIFAADTRGVFVGPLPNSGNGG